jgi:hypothetical protein
MKTPIVLLLLALSCCLSCTPQRTKQELKELQEKVQALQINLNSISQKNTSHLQSLVLASNELTRLTLQTQDLQAALKKKTEREQRASAIVDAYKHYQEALRAYNKLNGLLGPDSFTKQRKELVGILMEGLNANVISTDNRPALETLGPSGQARFLDALTGALEKRQEVWTAFEKAVSELNKTKDDLPAPETYKGVIKQWGDWSARNLLENAVNVFWNCFYYQLDRAGGPSEVMASLKVSDKTIKSIDDYSQGAKARGEEPFFVTRDDFQKMAEAQAARTDLYSSDEKKAYAGVESAQLALAVNEKFMRNLETSSKSLKEIRTKMKQEVEAILGQQDLQRLAAGIDPAVLARQVDEAKKAYETLLKAEELPLANQK